MDGNKPQELTRINPNRNIFLKNVKLTPIFLFSEVWSTNTIKTYSYTGVATSFYVLYINVRVYVRS